MEAGRGPSVVVKVVAIDAAALGPVVWLGPGIVCVALCAGSAPSTKRPRCSSDVVVLFLVDVTGTGTPRAFFQVSARGGATVPETTSVIGPPSSG
jgi:hypothetical protein